MLYALGELGIVPRRMKRSPWIAGALLTLVMGCGDGGSTGNTSSATTPGGQTPVEVREAEQAERIESQVEMFTAAFGSGDVSTACALIDHREFSERLCRSVYSGPSTAFERSFLTAEVQRVVVTGTTATVALTNNQILRMEEVGERWMVEDFGGAQNTTSPG